MRHEISTRLFAEAGGHELLSAYGIAPGEDPLFALAANRYPPTKAGKINTSIGSMNPAVLFILDGQIDLFAGIGAPGLPLPETIRVNKGLSLLKDGRPTRSFADLVLRAKGEPRPMLALTIGRKYDRALSRIEPTLDGSLFICSGEINLTFDQNRTDTLMEFMSIYSVSKPAELKYLAERCEKESRCGRFHFGSTDAGAAKAIKLMGFKGKADETEKARRAALAADFFADLTSLPHSSDPAWSIASRMMEITARADRASKGAKA